ncbi:site-specific DNA-methyltransferase [Hymenobacter cheonanensis]|uniref:site-specific DNA-methyltransferase n=1 Tax=Hymenobacter sp. CA2-7 TaxID=3063993 RepID=UPI002713ED4E|nr:site-specific DNA-methyltransferase [Hymenobacter sp. CA2-7]MDO7885585.1 site-specific DNA-methyltransferase [Hymenobacter sp. CA2-7]
MPSRSFSPAAGAVDNLRQFFPEALSEGKVDFERLRALLAAEDALAPAAPERYELQWAGKAQARRAVQQPPTATLVPDPAASVDWATTRHVFVEGENLEVLRVLQRGYFGQAKVLYLDPPYNTGSDSFVYADSYAERRAAYEQRTGQRDAGGLLNHQDLWHKNTRDNGQYHSAWLSMLWPRLYLGRNLLREDGVLFISIDDHEVHNLRLVLNEIFGEENFIAEIVLETATDNNPNQVSKEHEYLLVYAKNKELQPDWFTESKKAQLIEKQYQKLRKLHGPDVATIQADLRRWLKENRADLRGAEHYDNVDDQGVFHDADAANPKFGGYVYDVPHPRTGRACKVPEKGYRYPEATMKKLMAAGDILFGEDETTILKPKKRLAQAKDQLRSLIYNDGRAASKRLNNLLGRDIFRFPKDEKLLASLLAFVTKDDDLIIDFFAGSGSTGHAVLDLNAQDGGRRRYLLVQLAEPVADKSEAAQAGYRTIADITRARLTRAGAQLAAARAGQVPPASGPPPDLGFRAYRLAASNFRAWQPEVAAAPDLLAQLDLFQTPLHGDRDEATLLTELLLRLAGSLDGGPLSAAVARHEWGGLAVHAAAGGQLWLVLAGLNEAIVAAAVAARPQRLVVPGQAFAGENPDEQVSNARLQLADAGVVLQLI